MVRAVQLVKRSGRFTAVGGVSIEFGIGESVGIVGESGSGKTTLARYLLGLATPDGGTIESHRHRSTWLLGTSRM